MQISTSGGTAETDVKELTVSPNGVPSGALTVAIAIPVAKRPHVFRKRSLSSTVATAIYDSRLVGYPAGHSAIAAYLDNGLKPILS